MTLSASLEVELDKIVNESHYDTDLKSMSEDYKNGYKKGYIKGYANKRSEVTKAKKEAEKAYKETLENFDISSMYPLNVIADIMEDCDEDKPCREFSIEFVYRVFAEELYPREERALELYYRDHLTLDEAGKCLGVTRERVRQIIAKALRKLKHPTRMNRMRAVSRAEYEDLLVENERLKRDLNSVDPNIDPFVKNPWDIPIADLDLSVRSYNCLQRAGIRTVYDLCQKTEEEMMRVRNLGKRSLAEVKLKLIDLGYEFKPEDA